MSNRKVNPITERRRAARREIELPVVLEFQGRRIQARTKNLSSLGGYILTDVLLPPGEMIRLHILVQPPLEIIARIIWIDQEGDKVHGLGLGFNPLSSKEKKALEELLGS